MTSRIANMERISVTIFHGIGNVVPMLNIGTLRINNCAYVNCTAPCIAVARS